MQREADALQSSGPTRSYWVPDLSEQRYTLRRVRDTIPDDDQWPLPAPAAANPASTTGRASSTRLSTLVLSIVFLLSVFLVVQFFLSQEVTGKDKALEQLNAKIAQLNDLLSLEKLGKLSARRPGLAVARRACLGRSRARPRQGAL